MFKRLTKLKGNYVCWNGNQDYSTRDRYAKVLDRLAAYEDTGLTPEQIVEKETTLNGTYISMEAHNREIKKLKAEIGYEQDRIDCRNSICNANREGMYRKCAELESQVEAQRQDIESLQRELNAEISVNEALTADKDEQAGRIMQMEEALRQAKTAVNDLMACNEISKIADVRGEEAIRAIDALLGGKEDEK